MSSQLSWSVFNTWNDAIAIRPDRPLQARDYIWASELGTAYIDRFLFMNATPPTNPPNDRSRRKFLAGDVFEGIVAFVLESAGVMLSRQEYLTYQYPDLPKVTGKADIMAGGRPDYDAARKAIRSGPIKQIFGEVVYNATLAITDNLQRVWGEHELKHIAIEVKSSSSFKFDYYEKYGADAHHALQAYHYKKAKGLDESHVFYICKDDCRALEIGIFDDAEIEAYYHDDIKKMSDIINEGVEPPVEPLVIFDPNGAKFKTNWKVEYSRYLTRLYGFEAPIHYRDIWGREVSSINRVFKRVIDRANLTKANMEIIEKTKATLFPQWDELVNIGIQAKESEALQGDEPNEEGEE